jgi:phosphohistidine phosphatase SixA
VEGVARLMQAVEKFEAEPTEANLRDLARELAEVKGSVQSLGQALMLSHDPTLAAGARELLVEAKEAICGGQ